MIAEEKKVVEEQKETIEGKKVESKANETKLTPKMEEIMKTIENMSVLELSNLVKALEEKFGVSSVATVAAPLGAVAASGGEQPAGEEKTSFDVILANVGEKKIQVIKEIRAITTLGLKEAKDLVDAAPKPIKEGVNKEEAEEIKKKLEAVGATVELK
jgi:large subunit ribosomal protein L7/L12